MDDLCALDKGQLGERLDPGLVERWLEAEVEPGERFERGQPSHHERRLDPSVLAERQLLDQQLFDRLHRGDFTAIKPRCALINHFDGPRHLEANHARLDPVKQRCGGFWKQAVHAASPDAARRLPMAA